MSSKINETGIVTEQVAGRFLQPQCWNTKKDQCFRHHPERWWTNTGSFFYLRTKDWNCTSAFRHRSAHHRSRFPCIFTCRSSQYKADRFRRAAGPDMRTFTITKEWCWQVPGFQCWYGTYLHPDIGDPAYLHHQKKSFWSTGDHRGDHFLCKRSLQRNYVLGDGCNTHRTG